MISLGLQGEQRLRVSLDEKVSGVPREGEGVKSRRLGGKKRRGALSPGMGKKGEGKKTIVFERREKLVSLR